MKSFQVRMVAPDGVLADKSVTLLAVKAVGGDLAVLADHAPMVARLGAGKIVLKNGDQEESFEAEEGFLRVEKNKAVLTVTQAPAK